MFVIGVRVDCQVRDFAWPTKVQTRPLSDFIPWRRPVEKNEPPVSVLKNLCEVLAKPPPGDVIVDVAGSKVSLGSEAICPTITRARAGSQYGFYSDLMLIY